LSADPSPDLAERSLIDALDERGIVLPVKRLRFVVEYLVDLNGTKAAIRAGYSPHTAESQAARLLGNVKVREAVGIGQARMLEAADITALRVLRELGRVAFVDARQYFDRNNVRAVGELSADLGAAVAGFEVVIKNVSGGDGVTDTIHKFKLCDKLKALELLAKHHGLLRDIVEHQGRVTLEELIGGSMDPEVPA
jgi:phage terminase small subunit